MVAAESQWLQLRSLDGCYGKSLDAMEDHWVLKKYIIVRDSQWLLCKSLFATGSHWLLWKSMVVM
jgi:hypothetical protein